jgi:hypothetical protein
MKDKLAEYLKKQAAIRGPSRAPLYAGMGLLGAGAYGLANTMGPSTGQGIGDFFKGLATYSQDAVAKLPEVAKSVASSLPVGSAGDAFLEAIPEPPVFDHANAIAEGYETLKNSVPQANSAIQSAMSNADTPGMSPLAIGGAGLAGLYGANKLKQAVGRAIVDRRKRAANQRIGKALGLGGLGIGGLAGASYLLGGNQEDE